MTPAAYERHRAGLVVYCARRVGDAAAEDVAHRARETIRETAGAVQ